MYKDYIDWLIKSKSDPIKSLKEYLAQRPDDNAAAYGLARSGDDGIVYDPSALLAMGYEGPCVSGVPGVKAEYQAYLAHIRTTSTPIRPFREYLAQRPSANAAASGLARSGDGLDGGATS